MIEIKDLLLKFKGILLKEEVKKELIRETISKAINLKIKKEDIKIKNNTVYLNIKPIYKNEILFKREIILFELGKFLMEKTPKNFW